MQDLNLLIPPLSGITLTSAVGIDSAGEIVAFGTDASGQTNEYFLTPLESAVPEPSTFAIMGLMIVAVAARRRIPAARRSVERHHGSSSRSFVERNSFRFSPAAKFLEPNETE